MTIRISAELSHVCPLGDIISHATALESLGYYRIWVPDTLVSPWEAWTAAGIIIQQTKDLQMGLGVTNPYTRHPVVVAQMASTLQNYSGGRLSLAIGKGIARFLEKAGIVQSESAVEECIFLLHRMMAGERTRLSGNAFQIDDILIRIPPPEKPVPIYLAAMGPASWELALRVADGISTMWNPYSIENREKIIGDQSFPTAALVPFSLSTDNFMGRNIKTVDDLRKQVDTMTEAGFDETIIAYRDMGDLEAAAQIIPRK